MSKLIFFIGPGGSGKSTICTQLEKHHPELKREKLDRFERDKDPSLGIRRIKEIEKSRNKNIYLIDVGAFFQKHISQEFWLPCKNRLITIYNKPEICYENYKKREAKPRMSYNEYLKKEYNPIRKELYAFSNFKIVTNEKIDSSVKKAYKIIIKILTK